MGPAWGLLGKKEGCLGGRRKSKERWRNLGGEKQGHFPKGTKRWPGREELERDVGGAMRKRRGLLEETGV